MNYKKLYQIEYQKKILSNFKQVRTLLQNNDKGLLDKIEKRSQEYNIPVEIIKKEIMKYDTAVIPFATSPSKQNFYENMAHDILKKIKGITELKKLPNNSLYISRGSVIKKEDLIQYPQAKTIDFIWVYNNTTVYVSHKYTKDSGGSQDNQYRDLQDFIKEARDTRKNIHFIAIADGDYYLSENGRVGISKLQHLKSLCTSRVSVCQIDDISDILKQI